MDDKEQIVKNKAISIFLTYVRKCLEHRARFACAQIGSMNIYIYTYIHIYMCIYIYNMHICM